MELLSLLTNQTVLLFMLLLIRVTGLIVAAPFFSQTGVPMSVQVGIALALSFVLFPLFAPHVPLVVPDMWAFGWLALKEIVVGLLLGFLASMFFGAIQLAGSYVTNQIGIGVAHTLDPISNEQSAVMGQVYFILAFMLFLGLGMHHKLITTLAHSLELIPLGTGLIPSKLVIGRMLAIAGDMFQLSLVLVLPAFGLLLLQEVGLAFVSKIMPQMNVFMVALPLKILVGLILVLMTLPYTQDMMGHAFGTMVEQMQILFYS